MLRIAQTKLLFLILSIFCFFSLQNCFAYNLHSRYANQGNNYITSIYQRNNTLFIGSQNGLAISYDNGTTWEKYNKEDGLGSDAVWSIYVDKNETVYIGGQSYFAVGIKTNQHYRFNSFSPPPYGNFGAVYVDENKIAYAWDSSDELLIGPKSNEYTFQLHHLPKPSCDERYVKFDGSKIYVGTDQGSFLVGTKSGDYYTFKTYKLENNYNQLHVSIVEGLNDTIYLSGGGEYSNPIYIGKIDENGFHYKEYNFKRAQDIIYVNPITKTLYLREYGNEITIGTVVDGEYKFKSYPITGIDNLLYASAVYVNDEGMIYASIYDNNGYSMYKGQLSGNNFVFDKIPNPFRTNDLYRK
ncbi:MAG: hypothetical protein A3F12_03630 [Gammaproteobacteria bacterium RIFCSPHIGHO2_12_FULL_38_14]|nr:MAG: hypothetical protein A3F12_03630 [Gammaproteobacteria bacterium RIFCSPHIGHO2_12_FULL_38_14]